MFRSPVNLTALLHTVFITDGLGDEERIDWLLESVLAGGIRAVQLREPSLATEALLALGRRWMPRFDALGAALLINDRVDVALAGAAHGVHLKQASLSPVAVPGEALWVGRSVHGLEDIAASRAAHYLHLAPLFPTSCKPGAAHLGVEAARAVLSRVVQPVVLLGGINLENVEQARGIGASGVAVMSAICGASDPCSVARQLVATRGVFRQAEHEAGVL